MDGVHVPIMNKPEVLQSHFVLEMGPSTVSLCIGRDWNRVNSFKNLTETGIVESNENLTVI